MHPAGPQNTQVFVVFEFVILLGKEVVSYWAEAHWTFLQHPAVSLSLHHAPVFNVLQTEHTLFIPRARVQVKLC